MTRRGITLVETLIAVALLAVFGLGALGAFQTSTGHLHRAKARIRANQNARQVMALISKEMRQGIPNPHPGTGWLSAGLDAPSAVLKPTPSEPEAEELIFTQPYVPNFTPMVAGWDRTSAQAYMRVRYYLEEVDGVQEIRRERTLFNSGGGVQDQSEELVARGRLEFEVEWRSPRVVWVRVAALEGDYRAEYATEPFVVSR